MIELPPPPEPDVSSLAAMDDPDEVLSFSKTALVAHGEACARAALEAAASISPDSLSVPIEVATPGDVWMAYRSAVRALKDTP